MGLSPAAANKPPSWLVTSAASRWPPSMPADETRPADAGTLQRNGCPRPVVLPELREVDSEIDRPGLARGASQVRRPGRGVAGPNRRRRHPRGEDTAALRARIEPCLRRIIHDHRGQQVPSLATAALSACCWRCCSTSRCQKWPASKSRMPASPSRPAAGAVEVQLLNFAPGAMPSHDARRALADLVTTSTEGEEAVTAWLQETFAGGRFLHGCRYRESDGHTLARAEAGLVRTRRARLARLARDPGARPSRHRRPLAPQAAPREWANPGSAISNARDRRGAAAQTQLEPAPPRPNQSLIVLDPGLSFGTGRHPTPPSACGKWWCAARANRAVLSGPRHRLGHPGDRRRQTGLWPHPRD